jgi:hypothetical protein
MKVDRVDPCNIYREEMEIIADEAIAHFVTKVWGERSFSAGIASLISQSHEEAIMSACDAIESRGRILP